jgi:hypothetical protein
LPAVPDAPVAAWTLATLISNIGASLFKMEGRSMRTKMPHPGISLVPGLMRCASKRTKPGKPGQTGSGG